MGAAHTEPGAETRIKVFISYSRADKAFANDLVLGLAACGFAPYIDRQDIAPGEDWEKRLEGLIAEADSVVYVISPDSLASENCAQEFGEALRLRKRILPVVWRAVEDAAAPSEMKRLNYIFFAGEGRTFATGLADLAQALRTDIDWIREHTRLADLSGRWASRGRMAALLMRGDDIDAASAWLANKPVAAPQVTDDQADFIKASSDARADAERRARRARAGLLTAVSAVAAVFAGLAALAGWQWTVAREGERAKTEAYDQLEARTQEVRSANLRLGADIGLRTAPKDDGYFVVDSGWYRVAANNSGAVVRAVRAMGDGQLSTFTGFVVDGGMVHPRFAGEPLLVASAAMSAPTPETLSLSDTLSPEDAGQVQRMLSSGGAVDGVERLFVTFPALSPDAPLTQVEASERVWRTPVHLGGEFPFELWRLTSPLPFGWRAIAVDEIDCTPFDAPAGDAMVAMLGAGMPAEGGPSERALSLYISQLLDRSVPQTMLYTHANNRVAGGSPVFDVKTGGVLAIHVGSEPDPDRPGRRRGYGYSFRHLVDMVRSSIEDAQMGPVCGDA